MNPPAPDLVDLMTLYQQADPKATEALINLASPLLYRFLAAELGSRSEAQDLLQDVWLKVHTSRHTYRPGEPVLPWLFSIARHVRIDAFRKRHRRSLREVSTDTLPEPPVRQAAPEHVVFSPELELLLAPLPESQREVLTLLKVHEFSLEEVARITSSTVGSVKQKAHRAYERLRQSLLHSMPGKL